MHSTFVPHFFALIGLALAPSLMVQPAQADELPLLNPACGAKVEESFRLSGDRTCNGFGEGYVWLVNKAGITIDLNGFRLRGDRTDNTDGIRFEEAITNVPADDVIVRNGSIRGFGSGISIGSTVKRTTISGVTLADNIDDGVTISGPRTTVRKSTIVANDEDGVVISGDAPGAILDRNRIANNVRYGIFVLSNENTLVKNAVTSNGDAGILVNGDENQVTQNNVVANGNGASAEPGIYALFGNKNVFASNKIFGNGDDGYRDAALENEATNNTVRGNGFFQANGNGVGTGIDVADADAPKGSGNLSLGNDASVQCNEASMCKDVVGDPALKEKTPACGATVLKSFRLGADMTCTGTGLVVGAPNITIDLAGHTLRGDTDNNEHGIVNASQDGVRITNGVVRGFDIGVRIESGANANVVDRLISVDNLDAGFTGAGSGHVFNGTTAIANGLGGLSISSTTTLVKNSRAANNDTNGIFVGGPAGSAKIKFNVVGGNEGVGISVSPNANQSKITNNNVAGNGIADGYGGIDSGALGTIVNTNTVFGNGGSGYTDNGSVPKINLNRMDGNGYANGEGNDVGYGIDASVAFVEGAGNIAYGNDDHGECDPASLC